MLVEVERVLSVHDCVSASGSGTAPSVLGRPVRAPDNRGLDLEP